MSGNERVESHPMGLGEKVFLFLVFVACGIGVIVLFEDGRLLGFSPILWRLVPFWRRVVSDAVVGFVGLLAGNLCYLLFIKKPEESNPANSQLQA